MFELTNEVKKVKVPRTLSLQKTLFLTLSSLPQFILFVPELRAETYSRKVQRFSASVSSV